METNALMWFRKGLRIHDNPALEHARRGATRRLYPVFVLDPRYLQPDPSAFSPGSALSGLNRIQFLLESLADLDHSLRRLGSRLLVLRGGDPADVVIRVLKEWNIGKLCYEFDTEPYGQARDNRVREFASASGIEVFSPVSHTLFDPADLIHKNGGKPPLTYQSFVKLAGQPPPPIGQPFTSLPPVGDVGEYEVSGVPTIHELGYADIGQVEFSPFRGGESEALKRLKASLAEREWVANFEKPKGDPSAFIKPATTVLSPYLKFGCLSSRFFYQSIQEIYKKVKRHTSPPVSLVGQLLWRDFFYTVAFGTPNFDQMRGNNICKQNWCYDFPGDQTIFKSLVVHNSDGLAGEMMIPWGDDDKLLASWREGRTGFPWIDAIMVQLQKWGWMHHLARHSVACFLTRGDLFIHWEKGRDVFERLLIDSDWAINNGNWLWLSCSSFFYQYYRIYSPITFGKRYDPTGKFIRHFLPVLKDMPKEYIYEPWTAPLSVQRRANCIIGKDYPRPIVSHDSASKECRQKMGGAYALKNSGCNSVAVEDLKRLRGEFGDTLDPDGSSSLKKKKT